MVEAKPEPAPDSLASALRQAATVIAAVLEGRSLTDSLERCWRDQPRLAPAMRGAVQDLSYGALRGFGRGDFFLSRLLHKPLAQPAIRALLLAALFRLEARPDDAHTTVDQAVDAAAHVRRGGFKALVNAVLRGFLRSRETLQAQAAADTVARWQHPRWWIARVQAAHPEHWQSILEAGNAHPPLTLRVNRRRCDRDDYALRLLAAGIDSRALGEQALLLQRPVPADRLPGFADGLVSVQDFGAQQAAPLLGVRDGMRVLDACAAPGGKAAHLLELADIELTALDVDARRVERIGANLDRLGLAARVLCADCRALDTWWDGRGFDRILADVPCSASGVVRRHPDIKWLRRDSDITAFAATQAAILDALWRVLAPDGKLLYATCSVFPEENSGQVSAFGMRHEDCVVLPLEGAPGLPNALQLLPRPEHDGFHYALLHKRA
jgi:16S rRNA (cytosine967-C5)-methyltransferase